MIIADERRPRLIGDVVHVIGRDNPRRSDKTLLVAALLALGIPPAEREFFHTTSEAVKGELVWRTIWSLREESKDGRFSAPMLIRAWDSGEWLVKNPKHPLAIIRSGMTYEKAFRYSPKFSLEQIEKVETPDTWIEAAIRNLVIILRSMPELLQASRRIYRFGPDWTAFVPGCAEESRKKALLKHVEDSKRHTQALAA